MRLARIILFTALAGITGTAQAWWNGEWTVRKQFTVEAAAAGDPIGTATVLVRLYDGNFQFGAAREDGSDIRFVAADDKTPLKFHLERFDSLLYEAFAWVKLPDLKPGEKTSFWLYYGNTGERVGRVEDAKASYDPDTVLVYHFAESGAAPVDSSASGANSETPAPAVAGALIGGGARLTGQNGITIPAAPALAWTQGGTLTVSAWIKPATLQAGATLFSRREGENAFLIGEDNGVPFVELTEAGGTQRSPGGTPLAANVWRHLAVVASASKVTLYLDGEPYATLDAPLPALNGPWYLGKVAEQASPGFSGELDEFQISKVARSPGFLKLAAINQSGSDEAAKLLSAAEDETHGGGENEITKHLSLIAGISKSLTFDGWIVIGLCALLAIVGWWIAIRKFLYLNRIKKASAFFVEQWRDFSADLTVLNHGDEDSIRSMGGRANINAQQLMQPSPLYHLYQIGSEEIQHRLANALSGPHNLSSRSMQSIKATLDGGLVREVQRLNGNLVFLTIGIAGGPYLGLLGTVIGVMITFAVIAKSGEVEVNSIAPGIAGALLATVAGLAVAIPALFAYSYLSSRIKDSVSEMQIFIDEFIAKIAEFYSGIRE